MNQRTISQLSSFCLVIVLAFGISGALTVIPKFEKNHVRIFNNLDNSVLFYHCKSKDNDLGLRNLQTLFFCNFWYTNSSKIKFHAVFDVFSTAVEFIQDCGGYYCIWIAKEDGLYLYNVETKTAVKKHDWEIGLQIKM
ncbi:s-protein like protein 1 [Quercus suber]|uniref:S-protein homolog n=1 Tax=Quercus suber TaxID=58331 RepID=A0AAW0LGJ3_QUESU